MWFEVARHWLAVHVGIGPSPASLYWYSFWSGIGSDLGEAAIIGALIHTARHVNCRVKGCWRFARYEYELDGVTHKVCRHHHPQLGKDFALRHHHLLAHHAAKVSA